MVLFLGNFGSGAGHCTAEPGINQDIEGAAGRNISSAATLAASGLSLWLYVMAGYLV